MNLETLNSYLRRSGGIVAVEIAAAYETRYPDQLAVAYRRANPTFPGEPWVVHYVGSSGAGVGSYDLTREDAVAEARERGLPGSQNVAGCTVCGTVGRGHTCCPPDDGYNHPNDRSNAKTEYPGQART